MAIRARELIKMEYGTSRNFITPHAIRYGKLAPSLAYEMSSGTGIERGTVIVGVSVAQLLPDGSTIRRYDLSTSFSGVGSAPFYQADNYVKELKSNRAAIETVPEGN